jgi:hypothetical protein
MKSIWKSETMLRQGLAVMVLMAVPAFAWGQKKTSAPAPKPAAPSHASAPAQHSSAPAHSAAPSHAAAPSHGTTAGRGNTTAGHSNTMAGHGTTSAGHSNTMAGRGNTTASHGNTTAGRGNTTAGHGNTTASHGNTTTGRGTTTASHTNTAHTAPGKQVSLKGGGSAHIRPNGQIRSVNKNGMNIQHGMHGGRTVVSTHNGVRVVSNGRGRGGYTQRAYLNRGGHSYYARTYYYHGGYRAGVYRGYYYGGHPYYGYYPGYYYGPAYYGWAYNPWAAPVAYGWGWGGAPWYGYYGAYYQPYPVYPSAAFWLTDYLVAASLQAAYAAQQAAAADPNALLLRPDAGNEWLLASLVPVLPPAAADSPKLSPDVKKDLAEEVKIVLAAEQADAAKAKNSSASASSGAGGTSNEAPPALDPKFKTFVVSGDLSLVADGDECGLTDGDVVVRTSDTPDADQNVNVKVVAASKGDCAIGKEGPLAVDDLQEMYNKFREGLKDGMGELAKKQGTGGLPKSPDTTTTAGDVPTPDPDKTAEKTLQDQAAAADQTEAEVKQEAGSGGGQ